MPDLQAKEQDPHSAYRWYALLVLTLIYGCHGFDRQIMAILVEPLRAEFALSDKQLGLVTGLAYAFTFSIACIPVGILVDRVNRRNLLSIIVILWSGLTALAGIAQNFTMVLLARMGVGLSEAGASPAALSMIGDYFSTRQRATAAGFLLVGSSAGAAMAAIVGGYVEAGYGWRMTCFVAGVPGLLLGVLALSTLREPKRGGQDMAGTATRIIPVKDTVRFVLGQRSLLHLFMASPLVSASTSALSAWLGAFMMRTHGMDIRQAGWIMGASSVLAALGSGAGGLLSDRLSKGDPARQFALASGILFATAPLALAATLVDSTRMAILFTLAMQFTALSCYPIAYANALGLVQPRMRGVTLATLQVLNIFIGIGMGPFMVGLLSDAIGGGQSLRYAMAIVLVGGFCWASLHFHLARKQVHSNLERVAGA